MMDQLKREHYHPIFISYRRADGISEAKLLRSLFEKELGANKIFLDTSTTSAGEKWQQAIINAIRNAKVVIVFIGPCWKGENNINRLLEDDDWVRIELETALQNSSTKIFPLFYLPSNQKDYDYSTCLSKSSLPASLHSLALHQAVSI
ncbi:MAG: toll/interleukin-1 receptor domain-containing protein, partial [Chitinophagaceae bacterium]